MRTLVLVLHLVVSICLVTYPTDMLAKGHKAHRSRHVKSKHKGGKRAPGNVWYRIQAGMRLPKPLPPVSFASLHRPVNPTNTPSSASYSQHDGAINSQQQEQARLISKYTPLGRRMIEGSRPIITPHTASPGLQNYSRFGNRQRLTHTLQSRLGETNATIGQAMQQRQHHILQPNADYLTRGANAKTRLRTQLTPPTASNIDRKPIINTETIAREDSLTRAGAYASNGRSRHVLPPPAHAIPGMPPATALSPSSSPTLIDKAPSTTINSQLSAEEERWRRQANIYGRFKRQVNGYSQQVGHLQRISERARPYLYYIVEELSKHDMPMELALLPVVESAFQPTAVSPMSAAGIWQFMPETGLDFNLVQNGYYDARLDITASTRAAARFLYGLRSHFGDWLLALAAYNCGQGTVDAAIASNRAAGLGTDYWSLNLPAETMDYVPRLLAVAHIFANPSGYGLRLSPLHNEPYFTRVKIDKRNDMDYLAGKPITTVADMAGIGLEQFKQLNAAYINPQLAMNGPYTFLLPGDHAERLQSSLNHVATFLDQAAAPIPQSGPINPTVKANKKPDIPSEVRVASVMKPAKPANVVASPFVTLDVDGSKVAQQPNATLEDFLPPIKIE
jgi:soluble lytic murein transglycosylase-like protein